MQSNQIRMEELATTPKRRGLVPISPATIWRWVNDGRFPKPYKLSSRVTVWDRADIEAWIAQCKEGVA